MKSRTPRLEAKDTKKIRGQGQECSRPRTQAQVFSKKKGVQKCFRQSPKTKKRSPKRFFKRSPKKRSSKIFREASGVFQQNFNDSTNSAASSRGQGNFRELEASRPRTSKCVFEVKDVLANSTCGISHSIRLDTRCFVNVKSYVR